MLEQDYLMRLILGYFKTVVLAVKCTDKEKDPEGAAEMLEHAIGEATEIDGEVLLSLEPESMASILQVSGTDPKVIGYVAHGLLLASHYWMIAADFARAELREQQARALAAAYGIELPDDPADAEQLLMEAAEQGLFEGEHPEAGGSASPGAAPAALAADSVGVTATAGGQQADAVDEAAIASPVSASRAAPDQTVAEFAAEAKKARNTAFFNKDAASARFDPDAPLMPQEIHQPGAFGWQEGGAQR